MMSESRVFFQRAELTPGKLPLKPELISVAQALKLILENSRKRRPPHWCRPNDPRPAHPPRGRCCRRSRRDFSASRPAGSEVICEKLVSWAAHSWPEPCCNLPTHDHDRALDVERREVKSAGTGGAEEEIADAIYDLVIEFLSAIGGQIFEDRIDAGFLDHLGIEKRVGQWQLVADFIAIVVEELERDQQVLCPSRNAAVENSFAMPGFTLDL